MIWMNPKQKTNRTSNRKLPKNLSVIKKNRYVNLVLDDTHRKLNYQFL